MFVNGKFVIPCENCAREGVERAAGAGFVAGLRGMPLWLCVEHGGHAADYYEKKGAL